DRRAGFSTGRLRVLRRTPDELPDGAQLCVGRRAAERPHRRDRVLRGFTPRCAGGRRDEPTVHPPQAGAVTMNASRRTTRRMILRGMAGVTLGLPLLESISPFGEGSKAHAQDPTQP